MKFNGSFQNINFPKNNLQGRHKNSRTKKQPEQPGGKILNTAGGNNFKTAGGQKPKKQPGAKRPKSDKTAGIEKSHVLKINEGQFCPCCPAGGLDLAKNSFS